MISECAVCLGLNGDCNPWKWAVGAFVLVRLDDDGDVWVSGRLIRGYCDGEAALEDIHGVTHYCWPVLEVIRD